MLQLQAYLPTKLQEVLPEIQDYLLQIQIKHYLTLANTLIAIGALSAGFVAYKFAKILMARRRYAHIPGPETKGLLQFFVGNLPTPAQMEKEGKIFPDYLLEWHQQYGPVFKFQMLDEIVLSIIDPKGIKEALVLKNFPKSKLFYNNLAWPLNQRGIGHGLVTDLNNKRWREQRTAYNPGFHRNILIDYIDEFNSKADILMERLRTLADGKTPFRLFDELNHTTMDAIASVAFGMNLDTINNEKDRIFSDYFAELVSMSGDLFNIPFMQYNPLTIPRYLRFRKIVKFVRDIGRSKIIERLKEQADGKDILTTMAKDSLNDIEITIDNFVTFFVAGQETTANTLGFCFMELGRNKHIWEKCRQEVDSVLGDRNEITNEDITKLKYVGCVFKETLRKYSVAPFVNRHITEPIDVCGMTIPKDSHMVTSSYVTGRLESNFQNPLEFRPERFLKDANSMDTTVSTYSYFPFSVGPRNCIGQNFAQMEGIVILAKFIQKFDFHLAPDQSFQVKIAITLKPRDGTVVVLSLRQ